MVPTGVGMGCWIGDSEGCGCKKERYLHVGLSIRHTDKAVQAGIRAIQRSMLLLRVATIIEKIYIVSVYL